jgi:hypothetical protein
MKRGAVLVAAALVAIALLFARPHPAPGPPMRDFEAYYAAGSAANAHADPYGTAIWRYEAPLDGAPGGRFELLPFVSPPATLPLFRLLARMPFEEANLVWRAVLALCIAATVFALRRLLAAPFSWASLLTLICAAAAFGPLTSALALGQLALPAYALAVLALIFPAAAAPAWMQPNIALVLVSQFRRPAVMAAALAGAALTALTFDAHYVGVLRAHSAAERFSAIQFAPAAIAYGFGVPEHVASAFGFAAAVAAVLAWLYAMHVLDRPLARFCVTCAGLPFVMPFFHEHDLIVAFVPAIVLTMTCAPRLWPLAAAAATAAAVDWLGLAQRPDGALQSMLLGAAFVICLYALRGEAAARRLLAPMGVVAAAGLCALAASAHPLPVWPDAMHGTVHSGYASAAAAWHAEQAATGLFMRSAVWALLRCFSLAGCAGLAGVAVALNVDRHHVVERRHAVGVEVP